MVFNSYLFILAFLPITVIAYFLLNKINFLVGKIFLAVASAVFFAYGGLKSAAVFAISIIVNIILCLLIARFEKHKKIILVIDIIFNVALLFVFKYFNFFLNDVLRSDFTLSNLIMPLGISFFTFSQIMFSVNIYRGEIEKINILDYLVYILYFPKILMGPLMEPKEFIAQLNDNGLKKVNWTNIVNGLKIFSFGLFKKVIFADVFGRAVAYAFTWTADISSLEWFLTMLFYTLEIYFDFSGYSDMAVGISKMLNISLPINFDSPYKAFSIRDFWKRWHVSLTTFLTRYIYIPLGGNQKGKVRTYINIMLVFLISGIWHGANWTFIVWGLIHGIFCVFDRLISQGNFDMSKANRGLLVIHKIVRGFFTFVVVNFLWLLFRADSISQWGWIIGRMFSFNGASISSYMLDYFALPETNLFTSLFNISPLSNLAGMIILTVIALVICFIPKNNYRTQDKNNWPTMIFAALALLVSILCLSTESIFVYMYF